MIKILAILEEYLKNTGKRNKKFAWILSSSALVTLLFVFLYKSIINYYPNNNAIVMLYFIVTVLFSIIYRIHGYFNKRKKS